MEEENHSLHQQVCSFMSDVGNVCITMSLPHTSTGQAAGEEDTLTTEGHTQRQHSVPGHAERGEEEGFTSSRCGRQ